MHPGNFSSVAAFETTGVAREATFCGIFNAFNCNTVNIQSEQWGIYTILWMQMQKITPIMSENVTIYAHFG